jgi:poly(U)-binding-splicing factor PUF60
MMPNLAIFNRIYVGSINFELTEKEIGAVFSVFGPLKSVSMMMDPATKKHRGYGFLEFETPDAAALAQLCTDNSELGGRHIKVGRPNNFPNDLPPGVPRPLPNRIYIGNIHELIQEDEIRAIFEAFGPLKHCNLHPDPNFPKQHRGYGYVEYEAVADAINAMGSLNNFDLAGRSLKIGKTIIGGPIPRGMKDANVSISAPHPIQLPVASAALPAPARLPSAVLRAAEQINAAIGAQKTSTPLSQPETVIVLNNLADPSELASPDEQRDLLDDVRFECLKFGEVIGNPKIHIDEEKALVVVFVKYAKEEDCRSAIKVMDGRWFGGRQIKAKVYPSSRFEHDDLEIA